jgi:hypothetical protein
MTMSESLKKEQQSPLKGEIYRIHSQRSCHKVIFLSENEFRIFYVSADSVNIFGGLFVENINIKFQLASRKPLHYNTPS